MNFNALRVEIHKRLNKTVKVRIRPSNDCTEEYVIWLSPLSVAAKQLAGASKVRLRCRVGPEGPRTSTEVRSGTDRRTHELITG